VLIGTYSSDPVIVIYYTFARTHFSSLQQTGATFKAALTVCFRSQLWIELTVRIMAKEFDIATLVLLYATITDH
jgi:hypothetical protein